MSSTTARVARITDYGGPEVIGWESIVLAAPAGGEVLIRSTAVGINFIDTYHRSGLYPVPLPSSLGVEAAGIVEAVGPGVTTLAVGDRVATFGPSLGAYASHRILPAAALFRLPDGISDRQAAAVLLKGATVECLVERCAKVQPGWTVLVHAAAGGVGLLLVQWLKHAGATVIGTVSTEAKATQARAAGADHVILYTEEDCAARVRELTDGEGVRVAFDGIGRDTWAASLDSMARRGLLISYGNASGPVTGVALGLLAQKGSLFVTRPTLYDYYREPAEAAAGAARLFGLVAEGTLDVHIGQTFPLEQTGEAHRALEARETIGSTLLIP